MRKLRRFFPKRRCSVNAPQRDDARMQAIQCWLEEVLPGTGALAAASSDASFRRYFRTECDGATYIVMDAPPEHEDCGPFVHVAGWLTGHKIPAPRVIAQDLKQGFLLLDDLGTQTLLQRLDAEPAEEISWYQQAIDLLLDLQTADLQGPLVVPDYDRALLEREVELFPEWYLGRLCGTVWDGEDLARWQALKSDLLGKVLAQPQGVVHRDYHSRNLMVDAQQRLATIDFQDAVRGARSYDLISLLRDSYRRLAPPVYQHLQQYYYEGAQRAGVLSPEIDFATFARQCAVMAMQRHLKVAGIFARLWLRDGKRGYLDDIPLTLDYLAEVCVDAVVAESTWLRQQLRQGMSDIAAEPS